MSSVILTAGTAGMSRMVPAGYLLKTVAGRPEWLNAAGVSDVFSLSGCFSTYFADYIKYWKHNGYWLFNSPVDMDEIIEKEQLDRSGLTLFYYEVFSDEYDEDSKAWSRIEPEASLPVDVQRPASACLEGYDVACFSAGSSPECSPLSCNSLAAEITVNKRCLLGSFEEAKGALESGKFDNSEPGPFRVFAVYTVMP